MQFVMPIYVICLHVDCISCRSAQQIFCLQNVWNVLVAPRVTFATYQSSPSVTTVCGHNCSILILSHQCQETKSEGLFFFPLHYLEFLGYYNCINGSQEEVIILAPMETRCSLQFESGDDGLRSWCVYV